MTTTQEPNDADRTRLDEVNTGEDEATGDAADAPADEATEAPAEDDAAPAG